MSDILRRLSGHLKGPHLHPALQDDMIEARAEIKQLRVLLQRWLDSDGSDEDIGRDTRRALEGK